MVEVIQMILIYLGGLKVVEIVFAVLFDKSKD